MEFCDRFWVRFGGKSEYDEYDLLFFLGKRYGRALTLPRSAARNIMALALLIPIVVVLTWFWAGWIPLSTLLGV